MKNRILALIVTYNRLNKLITAIKSYENQQYLPSEILVIDNNSNDGTKKFLHKWLNEPGPTRKQVVFLKENIGGSGGFYEGMKFSLNLEYDWIWLSDDDAYPSKDAFLILNTFINTNKRCAAICSSVINSNGIDTSHRKIINKKSDILGEPVPQNKYTLDYFYINIFSFVGTSINKKVLIDCGLPCKDYFIWFDDTEYSLRVNEKYKIICVPSIKVSHDTIIDEEWRHSWKTYFGERNKLYTLQKHMNKKEFAQYLNRYRLGMIKHFFSDHKYYLSQRDGYIDFKKSIYGITDKHGPGKYYY